MINFRAEIAMERPDEEYDMPDGYVEGDPPGWWFDPNDRVDLRNTPEGGGGIKYLAGDCFGLREIFLGVYFF
jgi:hypothetical protein